MPEYCYGYHCVNHRNFGNDHLNKLLYFNAVVTPKTLQCVCGHEPANITWWRQCKHNIGLMYGQYMGLSMGSVSAYLNYPILVMGSDIEPKDKPM